MSRREVQLLWAGLAVGFILGAVVAVMVLAHFSLLHLGWAGGRAGISVISPY